MTDVSRPTDSYCVLKNEEKDLYNVQQATSRTGQAGKTFPVINQLINQSINQSELEVFRERRPPPNASIIDNAVNPDFGLRTPGSGR